MKILDGEKTKIIATIGPASSSPKIISEMIRSGVDGIRLNFSHGDLKVFADYVKIIRHESQKLKKNIAILGDLHDRKLELARLNLVLLN